MAEASTLQSILLGNAPAFPVRWRLASHTRWKTQALRGKVICLSFAGLKGRGLGEQLPPHVLPFLIINSYYNPSTPSNRKINSPSWAQ